MNQPTRIDGTATLYATPEGVLEHVTAGWSLNGEPVSDERAKALIAAPAEVPFEFPRWSRAKWAHWSRIFHLNVWLLNLARRVRDQERGQRGPKVYSLHAPEVECIGKGKAAAPYEFGVKASFVTNNRRAPGGLFVLHARALPDNPYDGHTLRDVIDRTEALTGCPIERAYVDKGYRGHDAQNPRRVFISGQKRGVFGVIKRELRRRSAIEPIIGHLKAEGHLGRCYLKGRAGDAANVVLSAVGHNFRRILAWLSTLLSSILSALFALFTGQLSLNPVS